MSKKKQKSVIKSKKPSTTNRPVAVAITKENKVQYELIHFDTKVWAFIVVCLVFFFLFVSLKWHNSSIPRWNEMVPDGGDLKRGLVAGKPLFIRSDEWLVGSSLILAQEKNGFPT